MTSDRNKGSQAGAGTHRPCSQYGPWTLPSRPCPLGLRAETQHSRLGAIHSAAKNLYPGGCPNFELQRLWELSNPIPSLPRPSCWVPERGRNLFSDTEKVSEANSPNWAHCTTLSPDRGPWVSTGFMRKTKMVISNSACNSSRAWGSQILLNP